MRYIVPDRVVRDFVDCTVALFVASALNRQENWMQSRATLVTGAAGLLGLAVAKLLLARGEKVIAVDRVAHADLDGVTIQQCDITDVNRLHELAVGGIGAVVHCGAYSGPMVARDQPYSMVNVNVMGTANVLEIARIHEAERVVFCSSANAYGAVASTIAVTEDVLPRPSSLYAASKIASEQLVTAYAQQYGVAGVSLRFAWIYGPRRTTDCVIRTMIDGALDSRPVHLPFGADFFRQFIHVDDAARSVLSALDADVLPQSVYNITGGTRVTLGQVASTVAQVIPTADITLDDGPDPLDVDQSAFDIGAASRDLAFDPAIGLRVGIASYADWLREARRPSTPAY
jgi:UDP-glucuronate 4-epimerase